MIYYPLAFSIAWAILFVYMIILGKRQKTLAERLSELESLDENQD